MWSRKNQAVGWGVKCLEAQARLKPGLLSFGSLLAVRRDKHERASALIVCVVRHVNGHSLG
jgi:hypothetical protein